MQLSEQSGFLRDNAPAPTSGVPVNLPDIAAARRPLRVLVVVDGNFPSTGGAEMQAALISRALAAAGHQVQIWAPRLDRARPRRETIDGIPVERIPYPRVRVIGAMVLCARFAIRLLRAKFDAVHIHMMKNLAATAGLVKPLLRASVMVKISGAWEFDGGLLDPARQRQPLTRMMNVLVKRVDHFQCISGFTRKMLLGAGYPESRICMIPNAVDAARFRFPVSRRAETAATPTVTYVGRMRRVKGLDVLVDAWRRVRERCAARLVIAGDGVFREELMRRVGQHGLAESVQFPGNVADVPRLLAETDIYVQPSRQEGLPNSVLEAMAAGLPIVATRVSGNEDLVVDGVNGRLVPPEDSVALAEALLELLADPQLAAQMGNRSRGIIEQTYQLPVVVQQLSRTYCREGA